jgi:predicted transcriptional regulator
MEVSEHESKILKLLFNNTLTSFTLYSRLNLPFEKFYFALNNLKEQGLLIEEEKNLQLTKEANMYLISTKIRKKLLDTAWKDVPNEFLEVKLQKDAKYVPNIELLDDKLRKEILKLRG